MAQPTKRLFVDPGSRSSGWAYFEGDEFIRSGTFEATKDVAAFHRIAELYLDYFELGSELCPDEVHIENFRKNLAIQLHHSVGAIAAALGNFAPVIEQDCWMGSWQRFHGYSKKEELPKHLKSYIIESVDELEAIAIGLWYLERRT
jgi:Holliday junction resolvasome RuvABC endonuclease subunit